MVTEHRRHVCGDAGGRVLTTGEPCGQGTAVGKKCVWHKGTPEERRLTALKGVAAARMKRALPKEYQIPEFASPETIIQFSRELARLALVEDVDLRRVTEARGAAALALSAHSARTQAQLVEALLKLEHGGVALALLAQFKAPDAPRRPLPWRVPPPAAVEAGAADGSPEDGTS